MGGATPLTTSCRWEARGRHRGADSGHLPAHDQFYCVRKHTVQSQGKAGSWKIKKLTVSGFCLGGLA